MENTMDDGDVLYVERNADHRAPARVVRPVPTGTRVYSPAQVNYPPAAAPGYAPAPAYPPAASYPQVYPQSTFFGQNPVYAQPPMWGGGWGNQWGNTMLGSLFGGVNIGQLINLVGQGFAAIRALPAAPASTGDVATDVANFTTYQQALAEHGKLDEQIRTGVHIIAKLLGA
jgi:hypothetical protein